MWISGLARGPALALELAPELALALALAACARQASTPPSRPPAAPVVPAARVHLASPAADAGRDAAVAEAGCTGLPPALTDYDEIAPGRAFSLEVMQDATGIWGPAQPLEMPMHYAARIEWAQAARLDAYRGQRVVVVATGLGRSALDADPRRGVWFATYGARVERVCGVSQGRPAARDAGIP
jgi:hypothetical protein